MGDDERTTSKPFTGPDGQTFEDFDACVRTFEDEDGIDDPDAFCAWLQDEGKDALSDPNAEEVLTTLEVEFVSPVDEPAQDSEWLIAKDAEGPDGETHRWRTDATLYVRKDRDGGEVKQVAFAPVLIPEEADKQGDVVPTPAIEDAAHTYLSEYRKVDSDHDLRDGKGVPVESWTLKHDTTFDRPDGSESREYPEGTWVMGIKFDDATWDRVVSGDLNGLSIYGGAKPVDVDTLLGKGSRPGADATPTAAAKDAAGDADGTDADATTHDTDTMATDDDPDDTGHDDESTTKQELSADAVSGMLSEFRTMVEDGSLSQDASVEDFVRGLIDAGNIDESSITGLSMFLSGGDTDADGGDAADDDAMSDDADGADDDGIDLDADKAADDAGDGDASDDGDVQKSVGDADGTFDDAPGWAKTLKSEFDDLREQVEDPPDPDRMANEDELHDRIVKDLAGVDDADVARKAIREQVEKSDDAVDGVDYDGITDDEDAGASASDASAAHSAAANTRMVGGDN
jgi:hypothetical protein